MLIYNGAGWLQRQRGEIFRDAMPFYPMLTFECCAIFQVALTSDSAIPEKGAGEERQYELPFSRQGISPAWQRCRSFKQ